MTTSRSASKHCRAIGRWVAFGVATTTRRMSAVLQQFLDRVHDLDLGKSAWPPRSRFSARWRASSRPFDGLNDVRLKDPSCESKANQANLYAFHESLERSYESLYVKGNWLLLQFRGSPGLPRLTKGQPGKSIKSYADSASIPLVVVAVTSVVPCHCAQAGVSFSSREVGNPYQPFA